MNSRNASLPIFYGSSQCGACVKQKKILTDFVNRSGKSITYRYYNLDKYNAPSLIVDRRGSYSMPTWWLPTKNGKGVYKKGIVNPYVILNAVKKSNSFGADSNSLGLLASAGKNFSNGSGFNNSDTFEDQMKAKWGGDGLRSVTFGRELGPNGSFSDVYLNNYFKGPGGIHPSGDYGTALALNRTCNTVSNPQRGQYGLVSDSKYKEIS